MANKANPLYCETLSHLALSVSAAINLSHLALVNYKGGYMGKSASHIT